MCKELQIKLGRNVRSARQRAELSQTRLALMVGISRPVLIAIEQGDQNITLDTLDRLAKGLEVEAWELLQ
ncbi:MAG TPA: helix-turn-helix domain-containing protein [Collinsella ihuae]|uniref:Helix-turn-helix domain-containing protein n=1 Tax=Collinsella ihumii TaxID=1720204 RepID=A0A921LQD2_9ACTN|nr:helix-turn-helix domain-containing protein [Collinsella ihumii]